MDIDEILSDIRKISNSSGSDFLQLSSSFPILIGELDTGTTGASNKIYALISLQEKLTKLIEQQMKILTRDRKFLSSFHEKNRNLFSTLTKNLDFLSEMTKIIMTIREASMEMEIISLNAMIVSIKSGKEGQAFSYITENLKQLSIRLISQSDNLISFENLIRGNISTLKETVDSVSASWTQLESVIGEDSFNDIFATITGMETALDSIITASTEVKKPILKAMEGIQHQDIIRQSLDDVQMTLSRIAAPSQDAENDEKLDQLTFNMQLAELAIDVLTNIKQRLDDSIALFYENQEKVNNILNSVETSRAEFIKTYLNSESSKSVSTHIAASISNFEFFMNGVTAYQESQSRVLRNSLDIQNQAMKIQACFEDLFPIIANLQYVAIAQRIEVARTSAINSIYSTVESMSELITKTHSDVEEAQEQLQSFIDNSGSLIQNFSRETSSDKNKFTGIMTRKSKFLEELQSIQMQFTDELTSFSVFSKDFFTNYQSIGESIENLKGLSNSLAETQRAISILRTGIDEKRRVILDELHLAGWDIRNDSFKDFIHHFTIVSDKQTAGTIAGLDIESGVPAGEITLF